MAAAVHVAGTLAISTDVSGSLAALGYSVNGVNITVLEFMENIPGDEKGGDAGPPIDVLSHGTIHIVEFDMTKWDDALAGQIDTRVKSGTAGSVSAGDLMRADSKALRLLLNGANFTRNYLHAIPRGNIQLGPVGSRYSRRRFVFECHDVGGVLYNSTTS